MTFTDLFENDDMKLINLLPHDGFAYYYGKISDLATADSYLIKCLSELSWEHDRAFIYGKEIVTKRKIAWYADEPVSYTYSGYTKKALVWPDFLREIKQRVESDCGETFNSCLCNFYSSGEEGMSWHSDAEKDLVENGVIGALTLGGERKFSFKHRQTGESVSLTLEHGSLLIMKGHTQKNWLHSLPKTKKNVEPRVSLTFRQMRC
ncbi:alpha-ketoglutarate-dependent dioxygenase AlkB [Halomonas sp. ISL-60]|uniref:alpha-ketoglutarate-dependent dioxygenase AlkB family protein n=1 Tax=unclassified Halomonas TaxID=2609666 RepID=UPI0007DA0AAB|nr:MULTISPECIES: alpha-ketoglutarate-dependent dioxygenase AlkB [unclassified Halomonas]MBT2770693.1 alpha-ketoglutarate-dependent dioxygenase AlkB [Halomonas sp. ISL-60]MBT2788757.1 alpha-ketoglutarate-dependent dioxygenase AlkB [Halomonas sp. ISL-106]MBT2799476.1 alpha-ketoglutarate-dependent dioxygenase AlkB [Halomonas sp. ISL-104]MBT2803943.1 alpha-ketoglutarate-dependent dioxygenase AlkB [Halomonas sp. ISL-56]OAL60393.1 2OG-Fe(II) oxygenase [Halomonas sp. ALS9]